MYFNGLYGSFFGSRNGFAGRGAIGPKPAKEGIVKLSMHIRFSASDTGDTQRVRALLAITKQKMVLLNKEQTFSAPGLYVCKIYTIHASRDSLERLRNPVVGEFRTWHNHSDG
jgi:hypothetical protein